MDMYRIHVQYDAGIPISIVAPDGEVKEALGKLLADAPAEWENVTVTVSKVGTLFAGGT